MFEFITELLVDSLVGIGFLLIDVLTLSFFCLVGSLIREFPKINNEIIRMMDSIFNLFVIDEYCTALTYLLVKVQTPSQSSPGGLAKKCSQRGMYILLGLVFLRNISSSSSDALNASIAFVHSWFL